MELPDVFDPSVHLEPYRRRTESALRQLLLRHGVMAHLKVGASFSKGVLELTIYTDPRAVQFIGVMR